MKYEVGDRVNFENYPGTVVDIEQGDYGIGYHIQLDDEIFDQFIAIEEQMEMIESICEKHETRRLYSKSEDEFICPFCE